MGNKKGFAVSTMLYGLVFITIAVFYLILATVGNRNEVNTNFVAQIRESLPDEINTITFNANGGTVSPSSKKVIYGSDYGILPTPTRNGYTFLGWNGKNLFSGNFESGAISHIDGTLSSNSNMVRTPNYLDIESNKTYTISLNKIVKQIVVFYYNNSGNYLGYKASSDGASNGESILTFTTVANASKIKIRLWESSYDGIVQLEEGTQATEWEPYYITLNTKVTRNINHTLTAIWRIN